MNVRDVAVYDCDRDSIRYYPFSYILSVRPVYIAAINDDIPRKIRLLYQLRRNTQDHIAHLRSHAGGKEIDVYQVINARGTFGRCNFKTYEPIVGGPW